MTGSKPDMRVIGLMVNLKVRENLSSQMEKSEKGIGFKGSFKDE